MKAISAGAWARRACRISSWGQVAGALLCALLVGLALEAAVAQVAVPEGGNGRDRVAASSPSTGATTSTAPASSPTTKKATPIAQPGKPIPLVNTDEDIAIYLEQAQDLMAQKDYVRAIEIIQMILDRAAPGFVATGDGRQYVSLLSKVNDVLARMGSEGLAKYRELHDAWALRMYNEAMAGGDLSLLAKIVRSYRFTAVGPKATEALAAAYFDSGRFGLAAGYWGLLLESAPDPEAKALLLGEMALAHHLDGNVTARDRVISRLKEQFASVQAQVGGQTQNVLGWAQTIAAIPTMAPQFKPFKGWPGWGGIPDGKGLMSECGLIVLSPSWMHSNPPPEEKPNEMPVVPNPGKLTANMLIATQGVKLQSSNGQIQIALTLKSGHVLLENKVNNGPPPSSLRFPPLIHPIIVDNVVIYRTDSYLVAWDLFKGELAWKSGKLEMTRRTADTGPNYYGFTVGDDGRNMITAGGGKVFTLLNFKETTPQQFDGREHKPESEGNALAALTLADQGKLAWLIGTGGQKQENELIAGCKFICAPTYSAGRLYVIATFMESYHLLCLDAQTGRMIWKSTISQTPATNNTYGSQVTLPGASSPAVADGKVFALTNAGVIGAFDAQDGQPLWAYQYESQLNGSNRPNYNYGQVKAGIPPNPVVVNSGRLYFLPCDCPELVCLSAQDGELVNHCSRLNGVMQEIPAYGYGANGMKQEGWYQNLTTIDSQRLLLSGDGLAVVNMADFKVTQCRAPGMNSGNMGIIGRPAVTSQYVLASGEVNKLGAVLRLDLSKLDKPDQCVQVLEIDPTGLLGNLVSAEGNLVAANSLGVAAYINYDIDKALRAKEVQIAALADKPAMFMTMGVHSFKAMKYSAALEEFGLCQKAADELAKEPEFAQKAAELTVDLPTWLYRTYVGMGNAAPTGQEMLADFNKALEAAQSDQEKARTLYRLSLCQEKLGDFATAAAMAQELIEKYRDEKIPESIKIGPGADPFVRDSAESANNLQLARTFGQEIVHRLVMEHGQALYEPFNVKAKEAYDKAIKDGDAKRLENIVDYWPSSPWALKGSFAAGESYYRQAVAAGKDTPQGQQLLGQAGGCLNRCRAVQDKELKDIRLNAAAGYALAYARCGMAARTELSWLSGDELKATVKFADYSGTLQALLDSLGTDGTMRPPSVMRSMKLKSKAEFEVLDDSACLVRDGMGRAVRLGDRLLIKTAQSPTDGTDAGERAILLDTVAGSRDAAETGSGILGGDGKKNIPGYGPGYYPNNQVVNGAVGGFSSDGKTFAVVDQQGMVGFDLVSSKRAWAWKNFASLELTDPSNPAAKARFGTPGMTFLASSAEGTVIIGNQAGKVIAVDIATGAIKWDVQLYVTIPNGGRPGIANRQASPICRPPQVGGGVVLLSQYNDFKVSLCDLGGGKLMKEWGDSVQQQVPGKQIQARLTSDGMLVTLKDDELTVCDAKAIRNAALKETDPAKVDAAATPLWKRKYDTNNGNVPRLLDVVPGLIVVQPKATLPDLEVLSVLSNQVVARIKPDGGFWATRVFPGAGNDLILVCSSSSGQMNNWVAPASQAMQTQGLNVQRWDLANKTGKLLWSRTLVADNNMFCILPAPVIGQNCLFIAARAGPQNMQMAPDQSVVTGYLLDMEKGQIQDQIDLNEKKTGSTGGTRSAGRAGIIGGAEMTNGRLCIETGEGIKVYAGQ